MPTSPRDLTDGKCRFLWENPPSCHRTSRADVGIGPYAVGETILSPTMAKCFRGPLHTRRKRGHPLQAGEGWGCLRPEEGRYRVGSLYRPTPVTPAACHPLPGEGLSPHPSGPLALPPSPKERIFICPRGNLRIRACLCSGLLPSLPGGLPALRRPWPPAHTLRGKRKWGRSSRSGSLRPGGCHRSA